MLTVLALPLFLTGIAVGGFFPALVVGAIVMLWFQPARDWLDGKAPRPSAHPAAAPGAARAPYDARRPGSTSSSEPRAVSGFGDRAGLLASLPPPQTAPLAAGPATTGRPPALVWSCVLAWVGSSLTFLVMLASVVMILAAPDLLLDEVYRQNSELERDGMTLDDLQSTALYVAVVLVAWSSLAIVLAAYAWRGRSWAWSALFVSSTSAALLCLLGVIGSPVMVIPLGICAVTAVLLRRPEVRAYFR